MSIGTTVENRHVPRILYYPSGTAPISQDGHTRCVDDTTHTRDGPSRSTTTPRMSAALSRLAANAVIRLPGTHYGPRLHRPHEHCTGARGQTHGHETQTDSRRTNQTATACTHKRRSGHSYHSFSTQSSRRTLLPQLLHTELETVFRVGTEFHEIADDALDTRREDDQSLPLHAICHLGLNANDGQPTPHALARL